MASRWVLPAIALLLLSGCTECQPPFSPIVPDDAPSEGGPGSRTLTITVEDDDGATPSWLTAWWLENEEDLDGESELVLRTLRLRSDDGLFSVHAPTGRTIHLVAGTDDPDKTVEWLLDAFPASTNDAQRTVHIYDATKEWTVTNTWSDVGGALCDTTPLVPCDASDGDAAPWNPHEIRFHEDDAINAGYLERVTKMDGALEWENTAGNSASFTIGFGSSADGVACFLDDNYETPEPGANDQTFGLPHAEGDCADAFDWPERTVNPSPPLTHIGPRATYLAAPLDGVTYTITLEAAFDARNPIESMCADYGGRDYTVKDAPYNAPLIGDGDLEDADAGTDGDASSASGRTVAFAAFGALAAAILLALAAWSAFTRRRQG